MKKGGAIHTPTIHTPTIHKDIHPKVIYPEGKLHEGKHPDIKLHEGKHPDVKHPDIKHPDVKHPDVKHPEDIHPDVKHKDIKKNSHIQLILSIIFVLIILIVSFILIYYCTDWLNWLKPSKEESVSNVIKCENVKNKLKKMVDDKCIVITCNYGISNLGYACNTTCTNIGDKVISVVYLKDKDISVCTTVYNCAPNGKVSGIASDQKHCNEVCTEERHNDYDGKCILSCDYGMASNNEKCNDTCVNTKNKYATGYDIGGTCKYKYCQYGVAKNEKTCNKKCNQNYPNTVSGKCGTKKCSNGVAECNTKCNSKCTYSGGTEYQIWMNVPYDENNANSPYSYYDSYDSYGYSYSGKCNYTCNFSFNKLYPDNPDNHTNIWYKHGKINGNSTCKPIVKSCLTNWRDGKPDPYSCCPTSCNRLCRTDYGIMSIPCLNCSTSGIYIGEYAPFWYKNHKTTYGKCKATQTCYVDENLNILDDCWYGDV